MNIRKTSRAKCRTCSSEIYEKTFMQEEKDYYEMSIDERNNLVKSNDALEEIADKDNRNNLFALDTYTASGQKTEVICRKHLQQLITKIQIVLEKEE